jgi:hypothetical protein
MVEGGADFLNKLNEYEYVNITCKFGINIFMKYYELQFY